MTGDTTTDTNRASARERLINPGPHPLNKRTMIGLLAGIVVFGVLWVLSVSAYSAEPAEVAAPAINAKTGLQAVVRAVNFNQNTEMLTMRLDLTAVGDLVDSRGILTTDVDLRVVDDNGVNMIDLKAGDPLTGDDIQFEMNGNVNQYPFDKYDGEFSLLAETVAPAQTGGGRAPASSAACRPDRRAAEVSTCRARTSPRGSLRAALRPRPRRPGREPR